MNATKLCSIENCESKMHARGWCNKHYIRWKTHGDPNYNHETPETCSAERCNSPHVARGLCSIHYRRLMRHGDPFKTLVFHDAEEAFKARTEWNGECLIWIGLKDPEGYGMMRADGRDVGAHRYAWERQNGPIPKGLMVDHGTCYNSSCVNIDHLRLATRLQNSSNRAGANADNMNSKIRNVYRSGNRWIVRIARNGAKHYFGSFRTLEEAAEVAEQARKELFGEYAGRS